MLFKATVLAIASYLSVVSTLPVQDQLQAEHERRQDADAIGAPYTIPAKDANALGRTAGINTKRQTFTYQANVAGGPYWPDGPLGNSYITKDFAIVAGELLPQVANTANDSASAYADSAKYNNLTTLDDYTKLYDGHWGPSSQPTGVDPGMLTNYTQDLLFSMEKLSFNAYALQRLKSGEALPFEVDEALASRLSGRTLQELHSDNRLFYVDYRNQSRYEKSAQYSAACDAYFYISPSTGDFLPLAIRTNVGSSLIYTPEDSIEDWMFAKILLNVNDFALGQFYHLAATHYVAEITYESAMRTLSDDHPVLAVLARLAYNAFGIRIVALSVILSPGGAADSFFGLSGKGATDYVHDSYFGGWAGSFQANYFETNLANRGLIGQEPALKSFPFYEDAQPIVKAQRDFLTSFVNSYYSSDAEVANDSELQSWLGEATGPAGMIDFPKDISTRDQLIKILSHIAYLVSANHHSINGNQLITGSSVLPFNPAGLIKPVPSEKGISNPADWLPKLDKVITSLVIAGFFARPNLAGTNRTLINQFNDSTMLARLNSKTQDANAAFMKAMEDHSAKISSRTFDDKGLAQGMPFLWKGLDPNVVPFSTCV